MSFISLENFSFQELFRRSSLLKCEQSILQSSVFNVFTYLFFVLLVFIFLRRLLLFAPASDSAKNLIFCMKSGKQIFFKVFSAQFG